VGDQSSELNIAGFLDKASRLFPNQKAIISAKESSFSPRTFKELNDETVRCSTFLHDKKIIKGDKVLLAVRPGYELILIAFSLFRIGAIPIIIDPGMGIKAFLKCIKNTKPDALIGVSMIFLLKFFFKSSFFSIRKNILIKNNHLDQQIKTIHEDKFVSPAACNMKSLAAVVFTSGSTGPPKGVEYTHKMFNAQINHLKNDFQICEGEVDLATLPIFSLFNPALGVTSIIPEMDPRKPALAKSNLIVETIQNFKVSTSFASPVIGDKIFQFCRANKIKLPSMKRIFLAGASPHPKLVEGLSNILPNGKVIVPYGATESLPISSTDHKEISDLYDDTSQGNGSALGKPLNGITIKIMPITQAPFDSEPNYPNELESGKIGEICVSGAVVSEKYFRMPGATLDSKFKINEKIFHRMGDLGYFDHNGILRFLGRKAERFMTKNGILETERCEPIVNSFDEVYRSALIGIGKEKTKRPCLVVELKNQLTQKKTDQLKRDILKKLNEYLPKFEFPYIVFQKSLPVDSRHNAKIHRLSLAKKWTRKLENAL
tara:strand:- start:3366 stop:5000 length:1635 start_codon:yes stop_codon:yes gene_type:complete